MPPNVWLKQNGPPRTALPDGATADAQVVNPLSARPKPMNMYSPLTLQLGAKAHSSPPPTVQVVVLVLPEVEMSQLPHPVAVVLHWSRTEAPLATKAAPPLT